MLFSRLLRFENWNEKSMGGMRSECKTSEFVNVYKHNLKTVLRVRKTILLE
jgi:hypothetical protein